MKFPSLVIMAGLLAASCAPDSEEPGASDMNQMGVAGQGGSGSGGQGGGGQGGAGLLPRPDAGSPVDVGNQSPGDTLPDPDAGAPQSEADSGGPTTPDAVPPGNGEPTPNEWACTQIMGVSTTGEWYARGFETHLDGKRFQAKTRSHAFVQNWSSPQDSAWGTSVVSPCETASSNPDRLLFTLVNFQWKTVDEWKTRIRALLITLKGKYSGLKRVELMTMIRAPGNKPCGNSPSDSQNLVGSYIDEAIAAIAAEQPELVTIAPKFEAGSCSWFRLPHDDKFTPTGEAGVAKLVATHYATAP